MKEKEPGIAGVLNIIPGLGYLYVNKKRTFGWMLLVSSLLTASVFFDPSMVEYMTDTSVEVEWRIWDTLNLMGCLLLFAAFIVDAYQEAKRHNARIAKHT